MAVANTLAYYVTATITTVKSFIVQAPDQQVIQKRVLTRSLYYKNFSGTNIRANVSNKEKSLKSLTVVANISIKVCSECTVGLCM